MKATRQWHMLGVLGMGLFLGAQTGCQTNVAGMTLPSGHYLEHAPQYIPPSPPFPLPREQASMEAAAARNPPPGAGNVPAPGL